MSLKPSAWRAIALLVSLFAVCGVLRAAEPGAVRTPILLELFTSEGCSSCPPADNWVEKLDAVQPVAGGQLIVLSEHVDYWDHDGWKDPYSSAQLTARQRGYAQALGATEVYTPQIIVDGNQEVHLANGAQVKEVLLKAAGMQTIPLRIESVAIASGESDVLTGRVTVDGSSEKRNGDVYVAVALDKTQTDVLAGENDGKKLTNVAVVKEMVKIGKLEKGKSFEQAFHVKLWPGADFGNLRVVAFLQEPGQGKILGAGMTKEIGKGN